MSQLKNLETRVCVECNNEKPLKSFLGKTGKHCHDCRKEAANKRYYLRKEAVSIDKKEFLSINKNETRVCDTCQIEKTVDEFFYPKSGKQCKSCRSKQRSNYRKNRTALGFKNSYVEINSLTPEIHDRRKEYMMMYRFKITLKDYDNLLKEQNYCCALCKRHQSEFIRELNVDHDHTTGAIRGLLCNSCNTGLGKLGDNIEGLQRAIEYLKKAEEKLKAKELILINEHNS